MTEPNRPADLRRWRWAMWGGAALLLLAPAVAMQVTPEVNWGPGDFAVFAAMLVLACGAVELGARRLAGRWPRAVLVLGVAGAFLLAWAHLAVGIW